MSSRLKIAASACGLLAMTVGVCLAVDISPSKYQGGTTNSIPNKTEGAPSLLKSPFKWMFGGQHSSAMNRVNAPPNFDVTLSIEPKAFSPSSSDSLKIKMTVLNKGKDKYILEFANAQHYDFIINQKSGQEVYRWSNDKIMSPKKSSIVVNPKEKLSYETEVFSSTNKAVNLSPGEYVLIGKLTTVVPQTPISVESPFQVGE